MTKLKGIDVSEFQGHVNWDKAKDHIDYAIIRIGRCVNAKDDVEAAHL